MGNLPRLGHKRRYHLRLSGPWIGTLTLETQLPPCEDVQMKAQGEPRRTGAEAPGRSQHAPPDTCGKSPQVILPPAPDIMVPRPIGSAMPCPALSESLTHGIQKHKGGLFHTTF